MLVYGDHDEQLTREAALQRLHPAAAEVAGASGIERHSALVSLLIEAGRIWQGVADAEFGRANVDADSAVAHRLGVHCRDLARAVLRSWESGFAETGELPRLPALSNLTERLRLKLPEGFAYYALYPEAYAEAARALALVAPPRVIGIRSIGTTLGAIVAAAIDAPPPITVRPFGDPFRRQVALAPELAAALIGGDVHYVIVDEGPGFSGSSFGAVADWLQARGVPLERIAFLPSHGGDLGPQASEPHRARWRRAQKRVGDYGPKLGALLRLWSETLIGPLDRPLREISGGAWRPLLDAPEAEWPPVVATWERRKFLADAGGERYLLKFAGLGAIGARKLAMARALHAEGLTTEPMGLVHGFIVERWAEGRRLRRAERPHAEIGYYIGMRARLFPAASGEGGPLADLLVMAKRNASLGIGDDVAAALDGWLPRIDGFQKRVTSVRTDNRLAAHEWLRTIDGRLLKTDALDHHVGHDLIGCQDMAWDVAGAIAEFGLSPAEIDALVTAAEQAGERGVDRELLDFYRLAYAAFRLGQTIMGAGMKSDAAEVARLDAESQRFRKQLNQLLLQEQSCQTGVRRPIG